MLVQPSKTTDDQQIWNRFWSRVSFKAVRSMLIEVIVHQYEASDGSRVTDITKALAQTLCTGYAPCLYLDRLYQACKPLWHYLRIKHVDTKRRSFRLPSYAESLLVTTTL